MINSLYIKNFALIESQKIEFSKGYTAFTGETGAGKSILFEALDFLLGKRGDTKSIKEGETKAIIEGEFNWKNKDLEELLETNGLDKIYPVIVRREISQNGRSRVFINDTPVKVSLVKAISSLFLNIHRQHELTELLNSNYQLSYLDDYSGLAKRVKSFGLNFKNLSKKKTCLEDLLKKEAEAKRDEDYYKFLLEELAVAEVNEGEDEKVAKDLERQENAEEIKASFQSINKAVFSEDGLGVFDILNSLIKSLDRGAIIDEIKSLLSRLKSVLIEVEDIATEAEQKGEELIVDEQLKLDLEDRLNTINALFAKHHVASTKDLQQIEIDLQEKLNGINSLESEIESLKQEIDILEIELAEEANQISSIRKKQAQVFSKVVCHTAQTLGMPSANFSIEFQPKNQLSDTGIDSINYLFSANKGVSLKPIQKVASGGELSRIMLSLKTALSEKINLQTQVFDEIDSGVSGEVAHKFGETFRKLGKEMQVFSITHLPQVAAQANQHYFVSKSEKDNKTYSEIKKLNLEERVFETAKLISSSKITNASLENAKQLLNN